MSHYGECKALATNSTNGLGSQDSPAIPQPLPTAWWGGSPGRTRQQDCLWIDIWLHVKKSLQEYLDRTSTVHRLASVCLKSRWFTTIPTSGVFSVSCSSLELWHSSRGLGFFVQTQKNSSTHVISFQIKRWKTDPYPVVLPGWGHRSWERRPLIVSECKCSLLTPPTAESVMLRDLLNFWKPHFGYLRIFSVQWRQN